MSSYPGGCLCGAIRYRLSGYADAGYCHCASCRRFTGAPVAAWALARAAELQVETGTPAAYGARRFCAACGSSLFRESGDAVAVQLGTLDDPSAIEPGVHQCIEEQVAWLRLFDLLPWVEGSELGPPAERSAIRGPAEPSVTRISAVSLRELSAHNLGDVLFSDVAGNQRRFVAHNGISVAQALSARALSASGVWIRVVYADDTVVGFVMASILDEDELGLPLAGDPDLWRFMIDSRYQGLGFGARALELAVAELGGIDGVRNVWLSCIPGSGSPYELYRRFGFVDTGVVSDGEVVMRRPLRD